MYLPSHHRAYIMHPDINISIVGYCAGRMSPLAPLYMHVCRNERQEGLVPAYDEHAMFATTSTLSYMDLKLPLSKHFPVCQIRLKARCPWSKDMSYDLL
jgi:hypothetical protein